MPEEDLFQNHEKMTRNILETTDNEPATIVIAGGGIVGLALAMTIKKQLNIIPEVYEKTSTFATEAGAGLGMYPNGLRVLRDISPDLLEAVKAAGYPYTKRYWERHDGTQVSQAEESILSQGDADLPSMGIRRFRLQKVLYEYALSMGITVHFNKALESIEECQDELVKVTFRDKSFRVCHVLFGADGALGKARSFVAAEDASKLAYTGVTCLMGIAEYPTDGIHFPSSDQDEFHAVYFPTAKNETCFQLHIPVNEAEANTLNWGNLSEEVGREECRNLAMELRKCGWHKQFIEPLEKSIKSVRVGFALLEPRLKTWVKGRVALVGDAAHPPVPYIGQGAQQGLEDAGVAVAMLKIHCLDQNGAFLPKNFEKAMKVYQDVRIRRSSQVLDLSKQLGECQAERAGQGTHQRHVDEIIKGEVLMYGTLPIMTSGAIHDYKEDVARATAQQALPEVSAEETMEALDYLFGGIAIDSPAVPSTNHPGQSYGMDDQSDAKENHEEVEINMYHLDEKQQKLIDWLVDVLYTLLQEVAAKRKNDYALSLKGPTDIDFSECGKKVVIDELVEVIDLPELDKVIGQNTVDRCIVDSLPNSVRSQLKHFVIGLSMLYHTNPFHNFEHACNVTLNVYKILSKMSAECANATMSPLEPEAIMSSDPLIEFACLIAALLHDADHEGVPNTQLAKEHPEMALHYKNKALAEQNSVDKAWETLMQPRFTALRACIYQNEKEALRFRRLIVNIVVATDICDKQLKEFRQRRWDQAFTEPMTAPQHMDRLATIGLEHLIQASDVSHTMQPWHIYRQWNERLYEENVKAFLDGRAEKDPTEFWYKGEIGFFDFYILPLAKKLSESGLFGSACDEFYACAQNNREEWIRKGESIVQEMAVNIKNKSSLHVECEIKPVR